MSDRIQDTKWPDIRSNTSKLGTDGWISIRILVSRILNWMSDRIPDIKWPDIRPIPYSSPCRPANNQFSFSGTHYTKRVQQLNQFTSNYCFSFLEQGQTDNGSEEIDKKET